MMAQQTAQECVNLIAQHREVSLILQGLQMLILSLVAIVLLRVKRELNGMPHEPPPPRKRDYPPRPGA